jgi:hypothetical protein
MDQLADLTKGYGGADLRVRLPIVSPSRMLIDPFGLSLGSVYRSCSQRCSANVPSDLQDE